jgi:hypothetical protein
LWGEDRCFCNCKAHIWDSGELKKIKELSIVCTHFIFQRLFALANQNAILSGSLLRVLHIFIVYQRTLLRFVDQGRFSAHHSTRLRLFDFQSRRFSQLQRGKMSFAPRFKKKQEKKKKRGKKIEFKMPAISARSGPITQSPLTRGVDGEEPFGRKRGNDGQKRKTPKKVRIQKCNPEGSRQPYRLICNISQGSSGL